MKTTEAQSMKSHLSTISRGHLVMEIVAGSLEFPTKESQEHAKTLSHINLVLSEFPVEVLFGL
jgi:hypothetical protein